MDTTLGSKVDTKAAQDSYAEVEIAYRNMNNARAEFNKALIQVRAEKEMDFNNKYAIYIKEYQNHIEVLNVKMGQRYYTAQSLSLAGGRVKVPENTGCSLKGICENFTSPGAYISVTMEFNVKHTITEQPKKPQGFFGSSSKAQPVTREVQRTELHCISLHELKESISPQKMPMVKSPENNQDCERWAMADAGEMPEQTLLAGS